MKTFLRQLLLGAMLGAASAAGGLRGRSLEVGQAAAPPIDDFNPVNNNDNDDPPGDLDDDDFVPGDEDEVLEPDDPTPEDPNDIIVPDDPNAVAGPDGPEDGSIDPKDASEYSPDAQPESDEGIDPGAGATPPPYTGEDEVDLGPDGGGDPNPDGEPLPEDPNDLDDGGLVPGDDDIDQGGGKGSPDKPDGPDDDKPPTDPTDDIPDDEADPNVGEEILPDDFVEDEDFQPPP